ncbi:hypothetical protein [Sphingomonas sp. UNC305MFCol5.2]|uniref:hypothetical protein n=1 Tax=Sphingomonas sp. UNC305MFCol5.2 TaxID=1449076 RepID=UPI000427EB11|nr:hypothetical protein [Sphingomonas sp. UNC305MFCol5.2]
MLHTPIPHTPIPTRVARNQSEKRLPPAVGILIAMTASVFLWGAIYATCVLCF